MQTRGKKPPLKLGELEEEKSGNEKGSEKGPGELTYVAEARLDRGAGGGQRNWSQVLLPAGIAVLFTIFLIFGFAAGKGDVKTLDANVREVDGRIAGISEKVDKSFTDLSGKVDTAITEARSAKNALDGFVRKGELPTFPDLSQYVRKGETPTVDLSGVEAAIATLTARIATLETEPVSGPSGDGDVTTKWTVSASIQHLAPEHADLRVEISPYRVGPDEDYYGLELTFYTVESAIVNAHPVVFVTLVPRDDIVVDRDAPYLVTDESPFTYWDTNVATRTRRDTEVTRQILFESDPFVIDLAAEGTFGDTDTFDLELELFYR